MERKEFSTVKDLIAHMEGYEIVGYKKDWNYWSNVWVPIIQSSDGFQFPFAIIKYKFGSAILVRDFALTPKVLKRVEWFYREFYSGELGFEDVAITRHPKTGKVINIVTKSFLKYKSKK